MEKKIYKNEVLSVFESTIRRKNIKKIVTLDSHDWVNIIPLTNQDEIVFVKQFRFGSNTETLEIPGGMIDCNEMPSEAASRELYEETGYHCEKLIELGNISPNPALFKNRVFSFLGLNAKVKDPFINNQEEINDFVLIGKDSIPSLIEKGEIDHALVICAFYLLGIKNLF